MKTFDRIFTWIQVRFCEIDAYLAAQRGDYMASAQYRNDAERIRMDQQLREITT